jgi:YebC/PmpR family DNA-binding regulatory protein
MSGHSKWANIKHRKSKQDIAKGKIFTKLIREIMITAKQGGDLNTNSKLRLAIDKAFSYNMSRDTIDRAIKRGSGKDNNNIEEIYYEGYACGGIAVLIHCLVDNRNRVANEIRHIFTKHGGSLSTSGSVAYLFKQVGIIYFPLHSDEDKIIQIALDAGAEDIISNNDKSIEVITTPENFISVKTMMIKANLKLAAAEIIMLAATQVKLNQDTSIKLMELIDELEASDDVQNVYTNADISAIPQEYI